MLQFCLVLLVLSIEMCISVLSFNTYHVMGRFSRQQTFDIFLIFSSEIGSDTSCKLSPKETICMKCQILFSRKNKKKISKCCLLKFLPSMQSVKAGLKYSLYENIILSTVDCGPALFAKVLVLFFENEKFKSQEIDYSHLYPQHWPPNGTRVFSHPSQQFYLHDVFPRYISRS